MNEINELDSTPGISDAVELDTDQLHEALTAAVTEPPGGHPARGLFERLDYLLSHTDADLPKPWANQEG